MAFIKRASLVCGVLVAVALSPAAAALAQPDRPPHPRDKACERNQAPPGKGPPFCEQYPPPQRDVACDRSKAPPGRPPFCRATSFLPRINVQIVLRGPLGASGNHATQPRARTYDTQSDGAGVASFQVPNNLPFGKYELGFRSRDTQLAPISFELTSGAVDGASEDPTGFGFNNGTVIGVGLIVLIGGIVVAARRRGRSGTKAG